MPPTSRPTPWHQVVRQLKRRTGIGMWRASRAAADYAERRWPDLAAQQRGGLAQATFLTLLSRPERSRTPKLEQLEAIAHAYSAPPELFVEFRLERARRALDPAHIGLDRAARNLQLLEQHLEITGDLTVRDRPTRLDRLELEAADLHAQAPPTATGRERRAARDSTAAAQRATGRKSRRDRGNTR